MCATTSPSTPFSLLKWVKAESPLHSPLPFRRNSNRNRPCSSLHFTDRYRIDQLHEQRPYVSADTSSCVGCLPREKCTRWRRSNNVVRQYQRRRQPARADGEFPRILMVDLPTPSTKPLPSLQIRCARKRADKPYWENRDFCHWQPAGFCVTLETTQVPWLRFRKRREAGC